jgi:signal transduction histidine kinase
MGIVQEHGGKIDVDSKWGYGTTFQITLPKNNPNVA